MCLCNPSKKKKTLCQQDLSTSLELNPTAYHLPFSPSAQGGMGVDALSDNAGR